MIFICDIDGVIAELTNKQKLFIQKKDEEKRDGKVKSFLSWKKDFYCDIPKQKVITENVKILTNLLDAFDSEVSFYYVTGRNECCRQATETWLKKYNLDGYANLHMRDFKDFRPSWQVKEDFLLSIRFGHLSRAVLVFEDEPLCKIMYKEADCYLIDPPNGFGGKACPH